MKDYTIKVSMPEGETCYWCPFDGHTDTCQLLRRIRDYNEKADAYKKLPDCPAKEAPKC